MVGADSGTSDEGSLRGRVRPARIDSGADPGPRLLEFRPPYATTREVVPRFLLLPVRRHEPRSRGGVVQGTLVPPREHAVRRVDGGGGIHGGAHAREPRRGEDGGPLSAAGTGLRPPPGGDRGPRRAFDPRVPRDRPALPRDPRRDR